MIPPPSQCPDPKSQCHLGTPTLHSSLHINSCQVLWIWTIIFLKSLSLLSLPTAPIPACTHIKFRCCLFEQLQYPPDWLVSASNLHQLQFRSTSRDWLMSIICLETFKTGRELSPWRDTSISSKFVSLAAEPGEYVPCFSAAHTSSCAPLPQPFFMPRILFNF